jgi:hypothetical protein
MRRFACSLFFLLLVLPSFAFSQQTNDSCTPPAFKIDKEKNMFNAQQEVWLGEILDDEVVKSYSKVEDPDGYLTKLGERLRPTAGHRSQIQLLSYRLP